MDKKSFEKLINKLKKDKKLFYLVVGLLVLILLAFSLSYLGEIGNISKSEKGNIIGSANSNTTDLPKINYEYEKEETENLKNILSKIKGVGEVEVNLRFAGSEVMVPAKDSNSKERTTEEIDSEGGKKSNSEINDDDKVVMQNGSKGNSPFILETKKPEVIGVMVVAQGAADSEIKYEISKAISNLYNISLENVSIFAME
ncbi:MAG: stage III sporulation protein AG [Sarcina sp.]